MRWIHVCPFTSPHAIYSSPGDKREWAVVTPGLFGAGLTASGKGEGEAEPHWVGLRSVGEASGQAR